MRTLLVVVLGLTVGFLGAQAKVLTAAADPWPPYVDKQNPTDGLALEIIRAALETQGFSVKMSYVPWARAQKSVEDGTVDILPDTWISEDLQDTLFFSEPYAATEIRFIKRKGDPFEYSGLESLKGKRIGIVKDYGYDDAFIQSLLFKKEEVSDFLTNISKLLANRIDLTLEDPIVATALMNSADPTLIEKVQFTKGTLRSVSLYLCSGVKNPRGKEIVDAFNKGLAAIKTNGTYGKIFVKYGIKAD